MKDFNHQSGIDIQSDPLISDFVRCCDDMIASKFILADIKISNILKVIASSKALFELFAVVLHDFDFVAEFNKCKTPNSFNRVSLRLPSEKRSLVAIVFTLLVEFDAKRRDLMRFLTEFYYSEDGINDSYSTFIKSAILIFKNNVIYLLNNGAEVSRAVREAEDYFNLIDSKNQDAIVDRNEIAEMVNQIREIISTVMSETSINTAEREELLLITEALFNAVTTQNEKLIRISWIGMKNTFKLKEYLEDEVENLGEKLAEYWEI